MAAPDLLAGTVMNKAASLMNDTARTVYTYAAQVPYLQMAMQELQEYFELHSIPVTEDVSAVIQVNAGVTEILYNAVGTPTHPKLPDNMIEPLQLWERTRDTDPWVPMVKKDFIPHYLEGVETSYFQFYVWQDQKIKLLASDSDNDIKIDYIKYLFAEVESETSQINIINARSFLEYRTAALLAEFIERNITSANALNSMAVLAMDRSTGISIKGKQNISTRRRPFRSSYKRNGMSW